MVISSMNCSDRTYKYIYVTRGPLLVGSIFEILLDIPKPWNLKPQTLNIPAQAAGLSRQNVDDLLTLANYTKGLICSSFCACHGLQGLGYFW